MRTNTYHLLVNMDWQGNEKSIQIALLPKSLWRLPYVYIYCNTAEVNVWMTFVLFISGHIAGVRHHQQVVIWWHR